MVHTFTKIIHSHIWDLFGPNLFAQAQKFGIFEKRSLWVSVFSDWGYEKGEKSLKLTIHLFNYSIGIY